MKPKKSLSEEQKGAKHKRNRRRNEKHKEDIRRRHQCKQNKQNEELATGMMDRSSAFEQLGCKVKEEERITTKIPDYQDIAIPPEYPSGYPARSPSPNNSWSRET